MTKVLTPLTTPPISTPPEFTRPLPQAWAISALAWSAGPVEVQGPQVLLQLGQIGRELFQLILQALDGVGDLGGNGTGCLTDSRADDTGSQHQHADDGDQRQQKGQRAADLSGRPPKNPALNSPHGDIEDKGHGAAQKKRTEHGKNLPHGQADTPQVLQDAVKAMPAHTTNKMPLSCCLFHSIGNNSFHRDGPEYSWLAR